MERSQLMKEISKTLNHQKLPKTESLVTSSKPKSKFATLLEKCLSKINCCQLNQVNSYLFDKDNAKFKIMLERLTENFETCFAMPDEEITKQGVYTGDYMYFILKGHCKVSIRSANGGGRERDLIESQYFGEISMFYKCDRTATVKSFSYDTFARVN